MKKYIALFITILVTCFAYIKNTYQQDQYAVITEGKLFYKTYGSGKPLVVLHGGPGMEFSYFLPQMLELSKNYKLIFYDQRGSGKSLDTKIDPSVINMNQFVEDLDNLLKDLNLSKVSILGHSWGGYLGISYALQHSEKVENLILLATCPLDYKGQMVFLSNFGKRIEPIQKDIEGLFDVDTFQKMPIAEINQKYKILFSTYFFKKEDSEKFSLHLEEKSAHSGSNVFNLMKQTSLYIEGIDLFPKLKDFKIPTLLIHGKEDIIPIETAREIHKAIPNSKMVEIDNCGHFPYIEQPDIFFKLVREFLTT